MADGSAVAQVLGAQVATLSIENAVLKVENVELKQQLAQLATLVPKDEEEQADEG